MKKTLIISLIAFLFSLNVCFAQELWNGTRYGMTRYDVKKMFPNGFSPDIEISRHSVDGTEWFRIDNFEIANEFFTVSFFFGLDEKQFEKREWKKYDENFNDFANPAKDIAMGFGLVRVNLLFNGTKTKTSSVCNDLTRALNMKYGKPINNENVKHRDGSYVANIKWLSSGTDIDLICVVDDMRGSPTVLLSYSAQTSKAVGKL